MNQCSRVLVLGPDTGWHASELKQAAERRQMEIHWATYESLSAAIQRDGQQYAGAVMTCSGQSCMLQDSDVILARTMPLGSLEQITFRLSVLHALEAAGLRVVNSPRTLEVAIDKYRTLSRVAQLGFAVPATRIVQSRADAMRAYDELGGDVVVKPLFGGEGRGVMRVQDRELAWYTFSTLEQLDAVLYVQEFVRPGGVDTRLLVLGDEIHSIRRFAVDGWKTNVSMGGQCLAVPITDCQHQLARQIADDLGLIIGSVDLLDCESGQAKVLEVNAVPGWKGAEGALKFSIADRMIAALG